MKSKVSRVVSVAVPKPLDTIFDYKVPDKALIPGPGYRVRVPFGNTESIGISLGESEQSTNKVLKPILEVIDQQPVISKNELEMGKWLSNYYHYPIGETLFTMIPSDIRRGKSLALDEPEYWIVAADKRPQHKAHKQVALYDFIQKSEGANFQTILEAGFNSNILGSLKRNESIVPIEPPIEKEPNPPGLKLNPEQQLALEKFQSGKNSYNCYLLEGITGSGKTEVYLQAMRSIIDMGKQVLVLVPEISLTPQTFKRFSARFAQTGLIHSGLTNHNVLQTWLKCETGAISCLVGTRSAVFAPLHKLGLIIVDEEHDSSYKQEDNIRYQARDLAVVRSQFQKCGLILSSATPSLETQNNINKNKYKHVFLSKQYSGLPLPSVDLIDLTKNKIEKNKWISSIIIKNLSESLDKKEQALIFLNRRGYSPLSLCVNCGYKFQCQQCSSSLVMHKQKKRLLCHYCG